MKKYLLDMFVWMASKEIDDLRKQPTSFIECAGSNIKSALKVARKYGIVKEDELRFDGLLYQKSQDTFYAETAKLRISSYHNLKKKFDYSFDPESQSNPQQDLAQFSLALRRCLHSEVRFL
jgi:hypothetical protein